MLGTRVNPQQTKKKWVQCGGGGGCPGLMIGTWYAMKDSKQVYNKEQRRSPTTLLGLPGGGSHRDSPVTLLNQYCLPSGARASSHTPVNGGPTEGGSGLVRGGVGKGARPDPRPTPESGEYTVAHEAVGAEHRGVTTVLTCCCWCLPHSPSRPAFNSLIVNLSGKFKLDGLSYNSHHVLLTA
jgi:hypothetical protein